MQGSRPALAFPVVAEGVEAPHAGLTRAASHIWNLVLGVEAAPPKGEARRAESLAGGQCGLCAERVRFVAE